GDSPRWIHWRTTARRGELMVREFEETPTDNLIVVVDPWVPGQQDRGQESGTWEEAGKGPPPFPVLEDALSLAATVCWEWCRQRGDRLVLGGGGRPPLVQEGVTGREQALLLLECLAIQNGCAEPDVTGLLDRLAAEGLPPAPVLLVSTRQDSFA